MVDKGLAIAGATAAAVIAYRVVNSHHEPSHLHEGEAISTNVSVWAWAGRIIVFLLSLASMAHLMRVSYHALRLARAEPTVSAEEAAANRARAHGRQQHQIECLATQKELARQQAAQPGPAAATAVTRTPPKAAAAGAAGSRSAGSVCSSGGDSNGRRAPVAAPAATEATASKAADAFADESAKHHLKVQAARQKAQQQLQQEAAHRQQEERALRLAAAKKKQADYERSKQAALEADARQQAWMNDLQAHVDHEKAEAQVRLEQQRQLVQEQDREYMQSLEQDQRKQQEREKQRTSDNVQSTQAFEGAGDGHQHQPQQHTHQQEESLLALKDKLRASLPEEPADTAAEGTLAIRVRLPDGSAHQRRFLLSDVVQTVHDWAQSLEAMPPWPMDGWALATSFPRQLLMERSAVLSDALPEAAVGGSSGSARQIALFVVPL